MLAMAIALAAAAARRLTPQFQNEVSSCLFNHYYNYIDKSILIYLRYVVACVMCYTFVRRRAIVGVAMRAAGWQLCFQFSPKQVYIAVFRVQLHAGALNLQRSGANSCNF